MPKQLLDNDLEIEKPQKWYYLPIEYVYSALGFLLINALFLYFGNIRSFSYRPEMEFYFLISSLKIGLFYYSPIIVLLLINLERDPLENWNKKEVFSISLSIFFSMMMVCLGLYVICYIILILSPANYLLYPFTYLIKNLLPNISEANLDLCSLYLNLIIGTFTAHYQAYHDPKYI